MKVPSKSAAALFRLSSIVYLIGGLSFLIGVALAVFLLSKLNFGMFLAVLVILGEFLFLFILLAATMKCLGEIAENTRALVLYARLQNQNADFEYDDGTEVEVWREDVWLAGTVDALSDPPSVHLKDGTSVPLAAIQTSDIRPLILSR
ncbi:MAG: hypothetical protein NT025_08820 [bacterium]|nr:hypothetical protein [bacterium]